MKNYFKVFSYKKIIKVITFTSFALLLCFFINSCKKTIEVTNTATNVYNLSSVSKITNWLDKVKLTFDSSGKSNIEKIKVNIDTLYIKTVALNQDKQLIIIPLKDSYKTKNITASKTLKNLVLIQDLNNEIIGGEIVEAILDKPDYNGSLSDFIVKVYKREPTEVSGLISFMTVSNKLFSEYEYKDGTISSVKYLYSKPRKSSDKKNQTIRSNELTCTDWYLQTYVNGQLISEAYLYTTCGLCQDTRIIGERGERAMKVQCSGGDGGVESTQAHLLNITNNLVNPCLKNTWNLISSNNNFLDDITSLLNNTFSASNKFNLIVQESNTLPSTKNAETTVSIIEDAVFNITITLNANELPTATKEFTVSTIYHEIIHSYLSTTGMSSQLDQHNEMANSYISCMQSALMKHFPTLGYTYANSLSWKGLTTTNAWSNLNTADQNEIILEQNRQHAGLHGTTCN